jgi:hypothetical protein
MREVLERIATAIEDNTRAVRDTLDYCRKRDAEQAEICTPTYRTAAELNALIIKERRAKAQQTIELEELAPGSRIGTWDDSLDDALAEEIP